MADKRYRKNDEIRVPEVFLVDETGEKIGKVPLERALALAAEKDLDLVEVAANVRPPVCRLMDFGTFLFEQKKKDKAQYKAKKAAQVKGIRFGIRISTHDFEVKVRTAQKFLEKGHPVKAVLQFRGREIVHDDLGYQKMKEFTEALSGVSRVDQEPKKQGKQIFMLLMPHRGGTKSEKADDE